MRSEIEAFFLSKNPVIAVAWFTGLAAVWGTADIVYAVHRDQGWDGEYDWLVPYLAALPVGVALMSALMFGVLKMRGPRTAMRLAASVGAVVILGTSLAFFYADHDHHPPDPIGPTGWIWSALSLVFTVPFAVLVWKALMNVGQAMHSSSESETDVSNVS